MKIISKKIWKKGQSFNRQEVVEDPVTGKKFRFTVHTDSYDFQAYGRAEVHDGDQWNLVHRIAGECLLVDCGLAYARLTDGQMSECCDPDMVELERVAMLTVSRSPETDPDVILVIADRAELATILASLRTYQEAGYGDPDRRPDHIHDIAAGDLWSSLDDAGIDDLCERINCGGSRD